MHNPSLEVYVYNVFDTNYGTEQQYTCQRSSIQVEEKYAAGQSPHKLVVHEIKTLDFGRIIPTGYTVEK